MSKMYFLCDFGFQPMTSEKWGRVIDNWKKKTALVPSRELDRTRALQAMKEDLEPEKMHFLKKEYKGQDKKQHRVTTGIAKYDTYEKADLPNRQIRKHLNVENLVGNPKSQQDPRFKGATQSLNKKLKSQDTIAIEGINPRVESLYENTFGEKRKRWVMNKDVWKRSDD